MDEKQKRNERLVKAAEDGNLEKVNILLNHGAEINYKDQYGNFSALHCAARCGHTDMVNYLSKMGADMNSRNCSERTPLHISVYKDHIETSKALIQNGTDVNAINKFGCTALHIAGYWIKNVDMAKMLVENGASVHIKDIHNITPVEIAAKSENTHVFEFLKAIRDEESQIHSQLVKFGMQTDHDFKNIVAQGYYESHDNRIYLVGPYNVGKTSLAAILVNDSLPNERCPTNGIWIHLRRAGMNIEEREWVFFKPEISRTSSVLEGFLLSVNYAGIESRESVDATTTLYSKQNDERKLTVNESNVVIKRPRLDSDVVMNPTKWNAGVIEPLSPTSTYMKFTDALIYNKIIELLKNGHYQEKIAPVDIWDFGGQDVYYVTHQLFICYRGTFVLAFDGSKEMNTPLDITSYLPGMLDKPTTCIYLQHWVNSILTYCKDKEDGYPKILFVATHKDLIPKVNVEKQRRQLIQELERLFKNHSGRHHLIFNPLVFVNATDKSDREIKAMKSQIVSIAFSHPRWGEQMPVAWIPLELQIAMRVEKGEFIMTKEEVMSINATEASMNLSESQVETFLRFQTTIGKLIYFDVAKLSQYVIINPLYLIKALKSIVTIPDYWPQGQKFKETLGVLSSKGILSKEALIKIWQQEEYKDILPYKNFIIDILCHLDILVEQKRYDQETVQISNTYLVPCMLTKPYSPDWIKDICSIDKCFCLVYNFEEAIIPSGLSYRILSSCLSIWKLKKVNEEPLLFAGCAMFTVDKSHQLLLCIKQKRILVYLINLVGKSDTHRDVAICIQECLAVSIQKISEVLYSTSTSTLGKRKSQDAIIPFQLMLKLNCECFINYRDMTSEVVLQKTWKCDEHNTDTDIKLLTIWFPEKRIVLLQRKEDIYRCQHGQVLKDANLNVWPTNKQLARLSRTLSVDSCRELALHLNVKQDTCQNIWDEYRYNVGDFKFMLLWKWKEGNLQATLQDILTALRSIAEDEHKFCRILIEQELPEETSHMPMDDPPKFSFLDELNNHIGIEALQLGIELDIDVPELEIIRYESDRNLRSQTREIISQWKNKGNSTLRAIVKALYNIERGMSCLYDHYKVK